MDKLSSNNIMFGASDLVSNIPTSELDANAPQESQPQNPVSEDTGPEQTTAPAAGTAPDVADVSGESSNTTTTATPDANTGADACSTPAESTNTTTSTAPDANTSADACSTPAESTNTTTSTAPDANTSADTSSATAESANATTAMASDTYTNVDIGIASASNPTTAPAPASASVPAASTAQHTNSIDASVPAVPDSATTTASNPTSAVNTLSPSTQFSVSPITPISASTGNTKMAESNPNYQSSPNTPAYQGQDNSPAPNQMQGSFPVGNNNQAYQGNQFAPMSPNPTAAPTPAYPNGQGNGFYGNSNPVSTPPNSGMGNVGANNYFAPTQLVQAMAPMAPMAPMPPQQNIPAMPPMQANQSAMTTPPQALGGQNTIPYGSYNNFGNNSQFRNYSRNGRYNGSSANNNSYNGSYNRQGSYGNKEKSTVTREIVKHIGIINPNSTSRKTRELNLIIWNHGTAKYDLREWGPNHECTGKGFAMSLNEAILLYELLGKEINELNGGYPENQANPNAMPMAPMANQMPQDPSLPNMSAGPANATISQNPPELVGYSPYAAPEDND